MPLPLAVALGGQVLGSVYQNYQSKKQNEAYLENLKQREATNRGLYNQRYYQDPTQTEGMQSSLALIRDRLAESNKNLSDSAVRTGSTAEESVATKGESQEGMNRFVNRVVARSTARKDNIFNQYMTRKTALDNERANYENSKRGQWENFGQNVAKTTSSIIDAYSQGLFKKGSGSSSQPTIKDGGQFGLGSAQLKDYPLSNLYTK